MRKRLIRYSEDKVLIPSRLYSGLVRSLAYKIDYQDKNQKLKDFIIRLRKIADNVVMYKAGEEYGMIHNNTKKDAYKSLYELQELLMTNKIWVDNFDFIESIYKEGEE